MRKNSLKSTISETSIKTKVNTLRDEVKTLLDFISLIPDTKMNSLFIGDEFLCDIIGGYRKKELTLILGERKSGKTALLVNVAMQLQSNLSSILFYSPRLSNRELSIVFLCSSLKFNMFKLLNREINKNDSEYIISEEVNHKWKYDNIIINDQCPINIKSIINKIHEVKLIYPFNIMMIDDLELVGFDLNLDLIGKIKQLKNIAESQDINIIVNQRFTNHFTTDYEIEKLQTYFKPIFNKK